MHPPGKCSCIMQSAGQCARASCIGQAMCTCFLHPPGKRPVHHAICRAMRPCFLHPPGKRSSFLQTRQASSGDFLSCVYGHSQAALFGRAYAGSDESKNRWARLACHAWSGGRDGLGLGSWRSSPWRGENREWSASEGGQDSSLCKNVVAGMDSAFGHDAPYYEEVKTADGLPTKGNDVPETERGSLGDGIMAEPLDLFPYSKPLSNPSSYWRPLDFGHGT
ncbi:hypothetical protein CRG98_014119 [Punica granatum]|uniref:Uncharacterized protein n=1 Tax=Punica granatum TaxID=22663 RepID=A0A2I0KA88_PUNGR|nr:hypothetical protein CRG98_014119 [Punica granatum]